MAGAKNTDDLSSSASEREDEDEEEPESSDEDKDVNGSSEEDTSDEEEEEEEDSDEEESSGDSSDEESSDEEEDVVDVKVSVLPSNDIRGFALSLSKKGLQRIHKALRKDYGSDISLFFRDTDGDVVTIKSWHDLQYAYRTARAAQTVTSGPSSSDQANSIAVRLKLFAEVGKSEGKGSEATAATTVRFADRQEHISPTNRLRGSEDGSSVSARERVLLDTGVTTLDSTGLHDRLETTTVTDALASPTTRAQLNYEVLWKRGELLGSGSFGKVYSGINLTSGERLAVKEVALRRGKDKRRHRQHVQALQLEVQILSSLVHDNIIKYYGTEYTKHTLRIFLELANDGTVRDAIKEFGEYSFLLIRWGCRCPHSVHTHSLTVPSFVPYRRLSRASGATLRRGYHRRPALPAQQEVHPPGH